MGDAQTKAKAAFFSGHFSDAVRLFTKAIALSPTNHNLFSYRSAAYTYLKNYSLALSDANKAIELNPLCANNYNRLGAAYFGLGYDEKAVEAYEKGLGIEPGNKVLKSGIEKVLKKRRRVEEARKEKEDGNVAYRKKDYESAIKCYSRAMEIDDEDICFITNRAAAYLEMGKYDECIRDCDKAVKRGRELRSDLRMIAKAFTRKGTALVKLAKCSKDFEPAIETFQEALAEHYNPDTFKKLDEAEKAKNLLEKQEYFDSKIADEEHEKVEVANMKKIVQKRESKNVQRRKSNNVILLESSDEDDCFEIDPLELTSKLQLDDLDPDADADVVVISCKGDVALRDFPHPRHDCGNFPFESTAHESYCSKCFCYVCEIAAPCPHWTGTKGHCNVSTEKEKFDSRQCSEPTPRSFHELFGRSSSFITQLRSAQQLI